MAGHPPSSHLYLAPTNVRQSIWFVNVVRPLGFAQKRKHRLSNVLLSCCAMYFVGKKKHGGLATGHCFEEALCSTVVIVRWCSLRDDCLGRS